ncbi:unnamed protein product [Psylliodes chrysocephalus]|uniref:Uncharacterized protein n=1 Tax=Psylliodes chrysocephalus TaxID=3402493 RepID=A0A9P0D0B2_9CUCU|nr:unnamed protein product [Psylliodes chrysocephala]
MYSLFCDICSVFTKAVSPVFLLLTIALAGCTPLLIPAYKVPKFYAENNINCNLNMHQKNWEQKKIWKRLCTLSQKATNEKIKEPLVTILDKIIQSRPLSAGRPTVLSKEDKHIIAKTLGIVNNWGFPMTNAYIAEVGHSLVTKEERSVQEWKENIPGYGYE